ncbi:MAG: low molecular weight phosphotyrosine protein phosphatase [Bacteroidetes bacterium]|uniref:protein-tyrosine-phosphatase n=1 Tax=Phaeocystidibacter marisrubri TaxID=1577780 RepID=A0A6L3ZIP5_9FLAO|nr:low molecular weight protein-tyrosine-phosphatase [Phaeocystidibacter marisrubri]KAB2817774.1 low molecular weight phosphotyrosine protein phosphatase [Phaeocystidibacter marisrubri]TNE28424.1 MAG: low molecular weight phosphotyrosine protein phosphatase [Bacteroidota bacterium]
MKILMVCLGNICRSPMAEGILRHRAEGTNIEVDSAGTSAFHIGENPDPRAVMTTRKHDVKIDKLVGRQFTVADFDAFDRIYVMDKSNLKNVLDLARNEEDKLKVSLLLDEADNMPKGMEVPDPYYGGNRGFEDVFTMIDSAAEAIVKKYGK